MILVVTGGCAGVADGRAVCQGEGLVVDVLGPLRLGAWPSSRPGQVFLRPDLLGYRSVSASNGVSVGTEARRGRPGSRVRRRRR